MSKKRLMLAASVAVLSLSGAAFAAENGAPGSREPGASASGASSASVKATSAKSATFQSAISEAQSALKEKGLYNGRIDGRMGPKTRQAISQFQRQNGLKQTAQLDARTMSELAGGGGRSGTASPSHAPDSSGGGSPSSGGMTPPPGGAGGMR